MDADNLDSVWKTQAAATRLTVDLDVLVNEVRRNQRTFAATIFWRDVREVGVAVALVPLWFYLGFRLNLPWTWYLVVPGLVWVAGFLPIDRVVQKRKRVPLNESLRPCVENSLAEVDHQIWLLRHILWWYILPVLVPALVFLVDAFWELRSGGWPAVLVLALTLSFVGMVGFGVYYLNQSAIRSSLEPRRRELAILLEGLGDEPTPEESSGLTGNAVAS